MIMEDLSFNYKVIFQVNHKVDGFKLQLRKKKQLSDYIVIAQMYKIKLLNCFLSFQTNNRGVNSTVENLETILSKNLHSFRDLDGYISLCR